MALLPAHDEEAALPAALASLRRQTRPPDRVVVVADNCTDRTAEVAGALDAEVVMTTGNLHKKAGALNQALVRLLPDLDDLDLVLVMDADSLLDPEFLACARDHLDGADGRRRRDGRPLGGVGGTFRGGPGGGLLGTFQRNEYARYARDVRRRRGRALVLTGTASVFPVHVLREVAEGRRLGRLPDQSRCGNVYDVHVLTEDNELSLALMHLGYAILAPRGCTLETEVMTTWRSLADQRCRWKRGALENIVDYGLTRVTASYWGRQLLSVLGLVATCAYLAAIAWGLATELRLDAFWLAVSLVFCLERVVTVRRRGWRQMLLAAPLVVEMAYDVFLQLVQGRAFAQAIVRSERRW
ncbi:glycosyltransferase [Nocardioides sp. SOB77]|uniref:Glycosyltransferase n=1 Tax=Nocardioides oceani TaxID=3058369 RepID=A0ABT8FJZ3_9ACTN|nr:glycosyltransferase [Nocardioides oceani]MDN4174929.1 glycosyltransferase [Nocardioides oceani]